MKNKILRFDIDVIVALAGLVVGVAGVLASEYYTLNRSHLACAICIASLGYLVTRNLLPGRESVHPRAKWQTKDQLFVVVTILFFVLLLASIAILTHSLYRRPPIYFLFFIGAAALLVLQITLLDLDAPWKQQLLLGQILLLGISFKAGAFFFYPTVSGIDPFGHQQWIEELLATGEFPQNVGYTPFPVMHLLAGATSLICGNSSKMGLFSVSILYSIALLAVFPMGKKLLGARTGLIAALLLSLSDYQIMWGVQIIPTSLGIAWFTLILMALAKRDGAEASQDKLVWTISVLLFLGVMLFTHTLSAFVLLVALVTILTTTALLALSKLSPRRTVVSMTLAGLFGIAMLTYWMWSFPHPERAFFTKMVLSFRSAMSVAQVGDVELVTQIGSFDALTVFAGEAGWTLLLVPATMGLISAFNPRLRSTEFLVWALLMAVFLGIVYGSGVMGVQQILPSRWIAFLYVPVCLLVASFLSRLLATSNWNTFLASFTVLLLCAILALMITSPSKSIPDSPLYAASLSIRSAFYTSELVGMKYAERTYQGPLAASWRSGRFRGLTSDTIDPLQPDSYKPANLIIVRDDDISKGFRSPSLGRLRMVSQELIDHLKGPSRVRVYDNGTVRLFLSTSYTNALQLEGEGQ